MERLLALVEEECWSHTWARGSEKARQPALEEHSFNGFSARATPFAPQAADGKAPATARRWTSPQLSRDPYSQCLQLAQSRHAQCADECPLLGANRTTACGQAYPGG